MVIHVVSSLNLTKSMAVLGRAGGLVEAAL